MAGTAGTWGRRGHYMNKRNFRLSKPTFTLLQDKRSPFPMGEPKMFYAATGPSHLYKSGNMPTYSKAAPLS